MADTSKANAEVVGEPRGRRFRLSRRATTVLVIVAGLLLVGAAGAAWATFDYTNDHAGRLLPGARIAGVDVGGLTAEQAVDAASAAIRPRLDQPVTVSWADRSWTVTPRELGAKNDAEETVLAAIRAGSDTSFFDRMLMVFGDDFEFERDIAITYPRQGVRGFIQGIASNIDRDVREAGVDYSSGWVEIIEPREGREVGLGASRRSLHGALLAGEPEVELTIRTVEPETDVTDYDQVLLVRIGENKLYLYEDGEITHEWPVATGLPEYPTPSGEYEVTELRYLPTWINPAPDTWGADMPAEIPPGPGNPLGLRAINWSAEAIRFHGTSATYSLGYNASHGCVRMSNEDVIELYDIIEIGTPIVSTVVAPLRPLYVSAPDPTVVAEDAGTDRPSTDPDEPERKRKRQRDG